MNIISRQSDFEELCNKLTEESVLFMDTEFCRRKTYFAKLSLIQIATYRDKFVIDALNLDDLSPLKKILFDNKICKVFHAPDQDLLIIYQVFHKLPKNIFDTQIAAQVVGMENAIGYGKLCKLLLNINLDKSNQSADWLARPLTRSLINYAIKDVEYLVNIYRELYNTIQTRNLWDNYNSKLAKILDIEHYKITPDKFLKKITLRNKSEKFMDNLGQLLLFREDCARELDVPRNHCATEGDMIKICEKLPKSLSEFTKLNLNHLPIAKKIFLDKLINLCSGLAD